MSVVAAFDLDGTITERDTLTPFLRTTVGRVRVYAAMARNAPAFARALRDRSARDDAKERLLRGTLAGRSEAELRTAAERFAPTVPLRAEVVDRLRAHQAEGHTTVVVSASPTLYVDALARRLGIDVVIATELEVVDGVLTGRFAGRNCRSEEKLRRLLEWLGDRDVVLHAYGNSPDDDPMLGRADHPTRV